MFATHQQPIGAPAMNFGSYEHFSAHGPDTSKAPASQGMGFSDPSTIAAAAALYMQQQQQPHHQQPMGPQHQAALQLLQQNAMLMASNPVAMAAAAAALQQQQQQQQQLPHQQHLAALSGLLANQFTATSQHHGGHAKSTAGALPMPTQNYTMPFAQPPHQQQPPLSLAPLTGAPTSVYGGMQHQLQSLSTTAPSAANPFGGHFAPQLPQLSSQYGASSLLPAPQPQQQQFQYQPQPQQHQMMQQQHQQPQSRAGAAPPPYGAGAGAPRHGSRGGPMNHTLNVSSAASASNGSSGSMTGASVPPPGTMGPNNSTVALAAYADPLSRLRRVAASVDHLGEASDEVHGRATLYEDYRTADSVPVEGAPPGRPSWKRTVDFVQVVVAQVSGPACREPAAVMDLLAQALLRCGILRREDIWFLDTPRVNFKDGRTTGLMSVKVSPAAARVLLFLSRDSVAEPTPHVAAAHDLPIETACDAPHIVAMRGGENSGNGAGSMPLSLAIAHPRPRILFVSGFSVLLSLTPAGVEQLLTLETHHQARQQQHLPRSGVTFALPWRLCVQRYQSINAYVLPPLDPATGLPVAPTPSATTTTTSSATAATGAAALTMPPLVTDSGLIFKQQDESLITSAPSVLSMPRGDSPTSSRNSFPM